jgi:predicted signal transduction protein with EAL and GGDEF domain
LPISTIKIDRSFISEITNSDGDSAIVQGVISMAHHLARMLHRVGQQHPNARFGGDDAAQSWKLAIY